MRGGAVGKRAAGSAQEQIPANAFSHGSTPHPQQQESPTGYQLFVGFLESLSLCVYFPFLTAQKVRTKRLEEAVEFE